MVAIEQMSIDVFGLSEQADFFRADVSNQISRSRRAENGQFLTPSDTAALMAMLFKDFSDKVILLDAGAGVGSLCAACVDVILNRKTKPKEVHIVAVEIEPQFQAYLQSSLKAAQDKCRAQKIGLSFQIINEDFLSAATESLNQQQLFPSKKLPSFTHAVLNPPYKKLSATSRHRHLLRAIGIETSNYYTAFLWLAAKLLSPGGELVSITPRSFSNGPYFLPFRRFFFSEMVLLSAHLFEKRNKAFEDDEVLQENIILHTKKCKRRPSLVNITVTDGPFMEGVARDVPYEEIVDTKDPSLFIHLMENDFGRGLQVQMHRLPCTLDDLGLVVSTGRVVDFRAKDFLTNDTSDKNAPLPSTTS